jgi:hypothetical protein
VDTVSAKLQNPEALLSVAKVLSFDELEVIRTLR